MLVHEYLDIDLEVVAAAVPRAREGFAAYVREVAAFVQSRESPDG